MKLIDSHCHIHFKSFDDNRDEVLARCRDKDIIMNTVGTFMGTSQRAVEFAESHDNIYATIGLHPTHIFPMDVHGDDYDFTSKAEDFDESFYDELAISKKVIGVGETGIDLYHMPEGVSRDEVVARQKEIFLKHAAFAKKHDLPLVIHVRDGHEEMMDVLQHILPLGKGELEGVESTHTKESTTPSPSFSRRGDIRGVVHCFTGNWDQAQGYLDAGLYLGFTGVVTFPPKKTDPKPQEELIEVIQKCPLDRMLVETDAPYLAPQKYRGQRSEPWMIEEVIEKIAEIKGMSVDNVARQVTQNTRDLFRKIA